MTIILNGTTGITTPDVNSDGLTVDSTTLVVDEANNRVGIGTSSPAAKLDVSSSVILGNVSNSANISQLTGGTSVSVVTGYSSPTTAYVPHSSTELVVARDGDVGLGLIASSTSNAVIRFGDSEIEAVGMIDYDHADDSMAFRTNALERLIIDSAGRVTMPYQPAFHAQNNNYVTSSGIIGSWTEIFDRGSNFNPSTGRFTAPVAGVYFFAMHGLFYNLGYSSTFSLYKNGSGAAGMSTLGAAYAQISGSYFGQGGGVVIQLAANDYIEYYFSYAGSSLHSGYIYAYGYLLG